MASLKQLYELIHSLDKHEKKHLSLIVTALGGKARARYANALKIINAQKEFDADKLKEKLRGDVVGMNLSEANNNLYDFACRALIAYQSITNTTYGNQLKIVELFLQKKLFESAHKLLQKIMPELEDNPSAATLLRAHELQEVITINYAPVNSDYKFRVNFFEQRRKASEMNRKHIEYLYLLFRYFQLLKTLGEPRNAAQAAQYEEIWNDALMHVPVISINTRTVKTFYALQGGLMTILNMEDADIQIRKHIEDYRKRAKGRSRFIGEMGLINSLLWNIMHKAKIDWQEIESIQKYIDEVRSKIPLVSVYERAKAQIITVELTYFIREEKYSEGIAHFENSLKEETKKKWKDALQSYEVYYIGARLFYLNNDPDKALDYLLMIQPQEKVMRPSFLIAYRFLFLLCHYKLKNFQFLDSAIISLTRSLKKMDKLYAPEKAMLQFLTHGSHVNKMESHLQKLSTTLAALKKDPYHKVFFEFGDYEEWLRKEK